MNATLHAVSYCLVGLIALTWVGNLACQLLFRISGLRQGSGSTTSAIPVTNSINGHSVDVSANAVTAGVDKAGHIIGWLERCVIAIGVLCHSWEIVAGVIALKSIARFKELDNEIPAEYFLIGSLFSLFWALLVSTAWLEYDHFVGARLQESVTSVIETKAKGAVDAQSTKLTIFIRSPTVAQ